jgi:hypothetical protein
MFLFPLVASRQILFPNASPFRLPRRITVMRIGCSIARDKKTNRTLNDSIKQNWWRWIKQCYFKTEHFGVIEEEHPPVFGCISSCQNIKFKECLLFLMVRVLCFKACACGQSGSTPAGILFPAVSNFLLLVAVASLLDGKMDCAWSWLHASMYYRD